MAGLARTIALLGALALAPSLSACSEKANASESRTMLTAAALDGGDGGVRARGDAGSSLAEDIAMPSTSPQAMEELSVRMRHLLEAIAANNTDLASDVLFPRDAFLACFTPKEGQDPQKVWEKKFAGNLRHQLERAHKNTKGIDHARFVSFELGRQIVQLSPKKRDLNKPLWRVKHSKLTFTVDGKTKQLDIAEMTAWRGAWYVTRIR